MTCLFDFVYTVLLYRFVLYQKVCVNDTPYINIKKKKGEIIFDRPLVNFRVMVVIAQ